MLARTMVTAVVNTPDAVNVAGSMCGDQGILLTIVTAPGDVGQMIGKQGRMARSIRTVLGAACGREGLHLELNLVESDRDREGLRR